MSSHPNVETVVPSSIRPLLEVELTGYNAPQQGSYAGLAWLCGKGGDHLVAWTEAVDLEPMFEVFPLHIDASDNCPLIVDGAPPQSPESFEPWPLSAWQTFVLRRAEFIVKDATTGPTFGSNPSVQSAARFPPPEASATCTVAVGLLFTGAEGRVLIACDWFPHSLVVTRDDAEIDAYLEACEAVPLSEYGER